MMYLNGVFIKSAENLTQCPDSNLPEFALIGRSNVGKSSFINAITNNKKLAKTSNTPGKTRLINYFNISDKFLIADLPGYGYAKISKETQNNWQKNLEEYLLNRDQIKALIQLIDARHDIQKNDYQMREWIHANNLPVITILTKCDYVSKNKLPIKVSLVKNKFGGEVFMFSTIDKRYNEIIINYFLN